VARRRTRRRRRRGRGGERECGPQQPTPYSTVFTRLEGIDDADISEERNRTARL